MTVADPAAPLPERVDRAAMPELRARSYVLVAVAVAALLWAVWATKALLRPATPPSPIVAVRLQPIVEEYVQAQARTMAPEAQVTRETQGFMVALDTELRRRGQAGTTVLVAEAVLSKNVPDVTQDVRRAVYARVPMPGAASAATGGRGASK